MRTPIDKARIASWKRDAGLLISGVLGLLIGAFYAGFAGVMAHIVVSLVQGDALVAGMWGAGIGFVVFGPPCFAKAVRQWQTHEAQSERRAAYLEGLTPEQRNSPRVLQTADAIGLYSSDVDKARLAGIKKGLEGRN